MTEMASEQSTPTTARPMMRKKVLLYDPATSYSAPEMVLPKLAKIRLLLIRGKFTGSLVGPN